MLRAVYLVVVLGAMIGCKLDFNDAPRGDGGLAAPGLGDAPPVPSAICKVDRFAVGATPASASLAVGPTASGFAIAWADTAGVMPTQGALLGPNHALLAQPALADITDTQLGGIADVGGALVLPTASPSTEQMRIRGQDLSPVSVQAALKGHLMGHYPYPSDMTMTPRAFVTGVGDTLQTAYVADDGQTNLSSQFTYTATGTVTELGCADGPNHAHCATTELASATTNVAPGSDVAPTTTSTCFIFDVRFESSTFPQILQRQQVSTDCHSIRAASGPFAADSMIIVWTTQAGNLRAHYAAGTGDIESLISLAGSAPRIEFDGTRFWIAWFDGNGVLQLSSFELDGHVVNYSLAGWVPRGAGAFELVHRGNDMGLVILADGELDYLQICS